LTKRGQMQGIYIQFSDKEPLITVKKAVLVSSDQSWKKLWCKALRK
jgi:hypothetical protein